MLNEVNLENVLVLDIETVPIKSDYSLLPEAFKPLWIKKSEHLKLNSNESPEDAFYNYAGIYAEFGKIICISVGAFINNKETGQLNLRIKSFADKKEEKVLESFTELLNLKYNDPKKHILCGHNAKEFDIPYICRRLLTNGMMLPKILNLSGKKPWEVIHLDTMQLWKFGDYKSYTSLNLLAAVFGIPTPKDDIDGSDVARVFWKENDLTRITKYCQKDVLTTAQILLKFKGLPILQESETIYVE